MENPLQVSMFLRILRASEGFVTNKDVDPLSRHFHYIAFDEEEYSLLLRLVMETLLELLSQLIVGLAGDLYTKVRGSSCLYLLRRSRWIFGFDSGIVRGGVAVYNVDEGEWRFIFLKANDYRHAQFASITRFGDYYIGCLGYPTAILVSKDLYYWYPLYIDPTSTNTITL